MGQRGGLGVLALYVVLCLVDGGAFHGPRRDGKLRRTKEEQQRYTAVVVGKPPPTLSEDVASDTAQPVEPAQNTTRKASKGDGEPSWVHEERQTYQANRGASGGSSRGIHRVVGTTLQPPPVLVALSSDTRATSRALQSATSFEANILSTWRSTWTSDVQRDIKWTGPDACNTWTGVRCEGGYVTEIALYSHKLTGSIPADLGKFAKLRDIDLSGNELTGSIPASLGNLTNLRSLSLAGNQMTGTIPAGIFGKSSFSGYLDFQDNLFTGSIPAEFEKLVGMGWQMRFNFNFFNYVTNCDQFDHFVSLEANCLSGSGCGPQRDPQTCVMYCNASSPVGACDGNGICYFSSPEHIPSCECNSGYKERPYNYTHPATCVPGDAPPPPPAPPPAEPRSNYAVGIEYGNATTLRLNAHSRYISAGSFLENAVPNWSLKLASTWMATKWFFLNFIPDSELPNGYNDRGGVLSWTPARDQLNCSSCWAHASADAISAAIVTASNASGGVVPALSAEQLHCGLPDSTRRCSRGFQVDAFNYASTRFLKEERDFPSSSSCPGTESGSVPQIIMYEAVQFRGWLGLLLTVQFQSAVITVQGSAPVFQQPYCGAPVQDKVNQFKENGFIMNDPSCYNGTLDHTVLVVGYDMTDPENPYWVIRNSWGEGWCFLGYMRLSIKGGAGTCGMNVLPAYYPIPRPPDGDPCYVNSTISSGSSSRTGVLNPCGGGLCFPEGNGYTCTCPELYVAVNNTRFADQPRTQSCVPVDACRSSFLNPCKVGICVNDYLGDYSCICPLGYTNWTLVTGKATCKFLGSSKSNTASYTVTAGVTCDSIANAYNLEISALTNLYPDLDCKSPQPGMKLYITNPAYSCSIGYIATPKDKTCDDLLLYTGLRYPSSLTGRPVTVDDLMALNVALRANNCSSITSGQLVCLRAGEWKEYTCTNRVSLGALDCGDAAVNYFGRDTALLYALNPGIDCAGLSKSPGLQGIRSAAGGEEICTGFNPFGTSSCARRGLKSYPLKKFDTCRKLLAVKSLRLKNPSTFLSFNPGTPCGDNLIEGQVICYR